MIQMETISLENRAKNIKFEHDRHKDFIEDALEGIGKYDECLHLPDKLDFIESIYKGESIVHVFRCNCGKKIIETFGLSERKVLH